MLSGPYTHSSAGALTVVLPVPSNCTLKLEPLSEPVATWLFPELQSMAAAGTPPSGPSYALKNSGGAAATAAAGAEPPSLGY